MASWNGTWRNQYGSIVVIEDDSDGVIRGVFRTALEDSSFFGQEVPIHGAAYGDVIGFTAASNGTAGPAAVSYTGLLRDGRLETLLAHRRRPDLERGRGRRTGKDQEGRRLARLRHQPGHLRTHRLIRSPGGLAYVGARAGAAPPRPPRPTPPAAQNARCRRAHRLIAFRSPSPLQFSAPPSSGCLASSSILIPLRISLDRQGRRAPDIRACLCVRNDRQRRCRESDGPLSRRQSFQASAKAPARSPELHGA
ncbi:avidin/streptavidin family protein [Inquilinus sp. YAF38]|uniref:avidin/streptavidin family protein n=1 Tax=Inquilinus sp. YAF38 TaxID=3233084 RepID=UPI003F9236BE